LHQSTLLYWILRQFLCLTPPTKYNTKHPTSACTNRDCYIEHFANAYAYHHIPNTTTNTPQLLAPIDTAISHTLLMLMLTSTHQIQQRTLHNCLQQYKLLQQHLTNAYAYHHIPNSTTNTPHLLAPINTATSYTLPMLMLTTTYQIQQRTPHNHLHQLTLLYWTLCQC